LPILVHLGPARVEVVGGLLHGVAHEPEAVQADLELLGGVAGAAPGLAVEVDERSEAGGLAADDRDHQG